MPSPSSPSSSGRPLFILRSAASIDASLLCLCSVGNKEMQIPPLQRRPRRRPSASTSFSPAPEAARRWCAGARETSRRLDQDGSCLHCTGQPSTATDFIRLARRECDELAPGFAHHYVAFCLLPLPRGCLIWNPRMTRCRCSCVVAFRARRGATKPPMYDWLEWTTAAGRRRLHAYYC